MQHILVVTDSLGRPAFVKNVAANPIITTSVSLGEDSFYAFRETMVPI